MHHPSIPNYRLLELIGEGGYGLVYKAQQNNTGQLVAIKILKTNQGQQKSSHQKARFERETQLCAQINHPHIVKLLDKGHTHEGDLFAVFEYIAGQTLKERITQQEGLSVLEASTLMGQVLDALVCAHEQGIVHRDLKPQNIMLTHTGAAPHIKVLDFGIGTFIYDYRTQDYKSLTLTKEMVGTPSYSAPEQLRGEPPTIKSDIYAWGLILVECLTGETVIQGDSIAEIFQQQLHAANVPLPPAILGHPVADLLRRVLDKNTRTRSGDALKLHEEYKQINFNTLVGKIAQTSTSPSPESNDTQSNEFELVATGNTKRQITMLCLRLGLVLPSNCLLETELLDSLQKDQLNNCQDIALRYGGYIAGTFADTVGVYFGYPKVSDNDARRAGRTALELISDTQKRSTLLQAQYGIELDIRISLHTGQVLTRANQVPEGLSLNIALHLLNETQQQAILVSDTARKLLDPYLEFGNPTTYHFLNTTKPLQGYPLLGERQTEALSFLRPWSANRLMIGRDQEKQQVLNTWKHIQPGKSAALLVSGQAGIGKSKLIYEAKKQLRNEGYLVRECRCLPEHTNNALFPFLDMLRKQWKLQENDRDQNIACLEEVLKAAQCSVKTTLPILCSWLAIPLNEAYEVSQDTPEKQKEILLNTLEKLLMNLQPKAKFLLIIEDLHRLDPTSQEFLERLLDHLPAHHYLLLMTTRPHFQIQKSYAHLGTIELQPLAQGFVKNMVEEVLGGKSAAEKMVGYIAERADGIPLFVEELTRMLQDQGYLVLEDGTYQLDHRLNTDLIPITLKDLLNARLDGLGFAKETAQLAATIGRNFDYDLLVQSSIRDAASVQADLNQLMNADLIYRQRKVQNEGYIFRHALIRDAAYDSMTKAFQKDTHGRIAVVLENEFPDIVQSEPQKIAYHYQLTSNHNNAAKYWENAGDLAAHNYANKEAAHFYDNAISQKKELPYEVKFVNIYEKYGDVLILDGDHEKARFYYEEITKESIEATSKARVFRKFGKSQETQHQHDKALNAYALAEQSLGVKMHFAQQQWTEWIDIQLSKLQVFYWLSDTEASESLINEMSTEIKQHGNNPQLATYYSGKSYLELRKKRFVASDQCLHDANQSRTYIKEDSYEATVSLLDHAFVLLFYGAIDEAIEEMSQALEKVREMSETTIQLRCLTYLTVAYRYKGNRVQTKSFALNSIELAEKCDLKAYIAAGKSNLGWYFLTSGDVIQAKPLLQEAQIIWKALEDTYHYPFQWLGLLPLIEINLSEGNIEQAKTYSQTLLDDRLAALPADVTQVLQALSEGDVQVDDALKTLRAFSHNNDFLLIQ